MEPFPALYRYIAERREMLTQHLVSGGAQTFEDYRRTTGALLELSMLESEMKDIERRYVDS
jgi:hypothetical protein